MIHRCTCNGFKGLLAEKKYFRVLTLSFSFVLRHFDLSAISICDIIVITYARQYTCLEVSLCKFNPFTKKLMLSFFTKHRPAKRFGALYKKTISFCAKGLILQKACNKYVGEIKRKSYGEKRGERIVYKILMLLYLIIFFFFSLSRDC